MEYRLGYQLNFGCNILSITLVERIEMDLPTMWECLRKMRHPPKHNRKESAFSTSFPAISKRDYDLGREGKKTVQIRALRTVSKMQESRLCTNTSREYRGRAPEVRRR